MNTIFLVAVGAVFGAAIIAVPALIALAVILRRDTERTEVLKQALAKALNDGPLTTMQSQAIDALALVSRHGYRRLDRSLHNFPLIKDLIQ